MFKEGKSHYQAPESKFAASAVEQPLNFEELYNKYLPELYRYAFKRLGHRETTEDLISVAFTKAFAKLDSYTGNEAGFRAWLYKITTNTLIDHYRERSGKQDTQIEKVENLLESPESSDRLAETNLTRTQLDEALKRLSKEDQEIIHLKYFAQYSNQEIAEQLRISPNSCGVKLYRALARLKANYPQYAE